MHVWVGISRKGRTGICVFERIMNGPVYIEILDKTLTQFLNNVYPEKHRFFQDNDPKHVSRCAQNYYQQNNINWWKTPAESPDANPIENLWHELKEHVRRTKPKNKQQLINTILQFWGTVDKAKCNKYINHLNKVIPKIIEMEGAATGY